MIGGGPMDVALRVRFLYEGGDRARLAQADVQAVAQKAQQLGGGVGGDRLARDLRAVSGQAQIAGRDLSHLTQTATRLGGDGASRLAGGLKDAGQAAGATTREVVQLGQVAARFGTTSTVAYLARDLRAAQAPAQALSRDMVAVGKAVDGIGGSRTLANLDRDMAAASRRADDLDRRLNTVGRRAGGRGRGDGDRFAGGQGAGMEFGNEAVRAAGLGVGGLRFGMGGAAAGGLALGAGIGAAGGGIAAATGRAIEFEHAMTEVGKAIGETAGGMRGLETQFLDLSRRSGIAKTEIAGIAAQGGYFNIPRAQLPEFTEISTKAAVGFQMHPAEAGEAFGPLMKSYKLPDMGALRLAGDAINTVGDGVGVRERNILNYLNRTSGVAGMLRIPLAQNAAIGGSIQSLGVAPDVAATSFDQVARRLANANLHRDPEFSRGLRGIGMSGRQVKADMDKDAIGGLLNVLQKLKDLKPEKRTNVIQDMFGEGEVSNVSRIVESLDTLREALDKVSDPAKYRGSLEKTFKIFNSDTTASINRASAALDGFATRIGQRFNPAVKASADLMARWLGGITKAMDRGDRAEAMARKMAKGEPVSPAEKAQADADPKLKRQAQERAQELMERGLPTAPEEGRPALERRVQEGRLRDLEAQIARRKARGLDASDLERQFGAAQGRFRELYPAEGGGKSEGVPGTGKRSDLRDGVRASLASYHEEVEQSLTRTERFAREMGRRIAEDLTIRPKVQDAAYRPGEGDGSAKIEHASLDGARGFGGRLSRGFGSGGLGGGSRSMPGRFGGALPMPHVGGGRRGSEGGSTGGGRRRGGSSEPAVDGPTESIPGTLNPRLAGSRKALMDELDSNPALRRDVFKTISMENRGSPHKMQAVLESMVNRSKMNGYTSLKQAIHSGFYGPVNRGGLAGALSEKDRRDGEAALAQVRQGSNIIGYRTDQGMLTDPGARKYMREPDHSGHQVIGGENFFYMGQKGRAWARRQEAEDAGQPNRAVAGDRRPEVLADPGDERRRRDDGPRQLRPWTRREDAPEARSPRFMDPSSYQLKPGAGGGDAASGGAGAGRFGLGGPQVVQNFHGGFDAHEVGRRAQLEQNREVRRTMAGALHDGMRPT